MDEHVDPYRHVAPRYLNPRQPPPQPQLPPKERIPVSAQYSNVQPRYLSPARDTTEAPAHKPISKASLFKKPPGHEAMAGKAFRGISSKVIDPALYVPSPQSPRKKVEERRHEDHRELNWRSDFVMGSHKYFDDHLAQSQAREKRGGSPKRPKSEAPSCIQEYIKSGIPIKHHSMVHLFAKAAREKGADGGDGEQGGGTGGDSRGGGHARSPGRGQSPQRRGSSPVRPWSNAGWQNELFEKRLMATAMSQPHFREEQVRVKRSVEQRAAARVEYEHVPRVATLSPGYRLQELLHEERERREASASMEQQQHGSRSPQPASHNKGQPSTMTSRGVSPARNNRSLSGDSYPHPQQQQQGGSRQLQQQQQHQQSTDEVPFHLDASAVTEDPWGAEGEQREDEAWTPNHHSQPEQTFLPFGPSVTTSGAHQRGPYETAMCAPAPRLRE